MPYVRPGHRRRRQRQRWAATAGVAVVGLILGATALALLPPGVQEKAFALVQVL